MPSCVCVSGGGSDAQRPLATNLDSADRLGLRGGAVRRLACRPSWATSRSAWCSARTPSAWADNGTTRLLADSAWCSWCSRSAWSSPCPGWWRCAGRCSASGGAQVLLIDSARCAAAPSCASRGAPVAVVIGGAVAMSSTAIIISQLTEQSENNRTHGRLAVAICLFQDLSSRCCWPWCPRSAAAAPADARQIGLAVAFALLALGLVLARGPLAAAAVVLDDRLGAARRSCSPSRFCWRCSPRPGRRTPPDCRSRSAPFSPA